jgi:hypothetical protein
MLAIRFVQSKEFGDDGKEDHYASGASEYLAVAPHKPSNYGRQD